MLNRIISALKPKSANNSQQDSGVKEPLIRPSNAYQNLQDDPEMQSPLIRASMSDDADIVDRMLSICSNNPDKYKAFEIALENKNWKVLKVLLHHGVLRAPIHALAVPMHAISYQAKCDDFGRMISTLVKQTDGIKLDDNKLTDFKDLLHEIAMQDLAIAKKESELYDRVTTESRYTQSFSLREIDTHPYLHLLQAIGLPMAPLPSTDVKNALRLFHYHQVMHGATDENILVRATAGNILSKRAIRYTETCLSNFGSNKDGCRTLFYDLYMRRDLNLKGENLIEEAQKLYSRPDYIAQLAKPDKVFLFSFTTEGAKEAGEKNSKQFLSI